MEIFALSRTLTNRTVLRSGTAIGLLIALSVPVGHAAAQEGAVAQEQIEEGESVLAAGEAIALDEVLVLSADEQLKQAPGVSIITATDIEHRPPVNDLSDIIRRQPGVNLTGNSASGVRGNNRQIDIRGMGPENTLILIDGKPVLSRNAIRYGRSGERDTRGDSNWVPPEAVERIEVLRGPAAARYGSGAAGGVVNIITKRPAEQSVTVSSYVNIPQHSEEGKTFRGNVFAGGPLGQDFAYRVYGSYSKTNADDPAINADAALLPSDIPAGREGVVNKDVRGVLTWYANESHEFEFEAGYSRQGNIFTGDRQLAGTSSIIEELASQGEETNTLYRTTLALTHRGNYEFGTSNSYVQWENTRNNRFLEGTAGSGEGAISSNLEKGTITLDNWAAKSEFNIPFTYHFDQNVTVGAEFRGEYMDDPVSLRQGIASGVVIPGVPSDPADRDSKIDAQLYGLYLEDNIHVTDKLIVTPGIRGDYHSEFGSNASPSLNASYDLTDEISLKAGIARAFKAPNLYQLNENYVYFTMGNGCPFNFPSLGLGCYVIGNPDLKAETSINKEVGINYINDAGWQAGLTYFHNDYKDRITAGVVPVGVLGRAQLFQWDNTPKAVLSGLEGNLLVPLLDTVNWRTNATYMLESEDKETGNPLSLVPEYTVNTALEWQATERLFTALTLTHYGKTEAPSQNVVTGRLATNTDDLDPYTLVGFNVDFQANEQLRIGAGVSNIFDERLFRKGSGNAAGAATFNEPGRSFYLKVSTTF
ncbi:FepA family TonB-dependent siderophore receptor [Aureimonas altamirensis]|uniref:FepA family TonB-dependent siderophore receptor n=1 Tax=Aureimonas altamirensis TaxID=370622 RepID=UPI001E46DFB5|nr:FepA family TonB-dependent siderophore receptor [Aureimonas altamirensis]UHD46818.1 FepA family TonB-dependent siderophore receptor [Aureimonas altamirensis]